MIQQRNIAVCIILSIVTCGIYGIYWFIVLSNDTNTVSNAENATSGGVAFVLSLTTGMEEQLRLNFNPSLRRPSRRRPRAARSSLSAPTARPGA